MKSNFYAHRGNLYGPNPEQENKIEYIEQAINLGFNVEVDVWYNQDGNYYLGHDFPQYLISKEYLFERADKLLVHAKNNETFLKLYSKKINIFLHTTEKSVLTSKNNIIFHPDYYPTENIPLFAIFSMPELSQIKPSFDKGIITDYASTLNDYLETKTPELANLLPENLR